MSTLTERQKRKEYSKIAAEIIQLETYIKRRNREYDAKHGAGAYARRRRETTAISAPRPSPSPEQLALVTRYFEAIKDPRQVDTPEKPADTITHKAVSLVDKMHIDGRLPMVLQHAAIRYRDLYFRSEGPSQGVANYGDFVPSDGTGRCLTSDDRLEAYDQLKRATLSAFGVIDMDGRWRLDEQLMQIVVPTIIYDAKSITQGSVGRQRTLYSGRAQVNSAGGTVIVEVLQKLALFFVYRER